MVESSGSCDSGHLTADTYTHVLGDEAELDYAGLFA